MAGVPQANVLIPILIVSLAIDISLNESQKTLDELEHCQVKVNEQKHR